MNKRRLLIIDDERDYAELVRCLLEMSGFAVDASTDGEEAFERLKGGRYDAVILDLLMPRMDGLAWLRRLRALPEHARTPVFVVSSKSLTGEERRELVAGDTYFVQKPFEPRRFSRLLSEAIPGKGSVGSEGR